MRSDRLLIYCFDGKQYQECQTSPHFCDAFGGLRSDHRNVKTLLPQYVNRGWQMVSSVALREFEQFLRY